MLAMGESAWKVFKNSVSYVSEILFSWFAKNLYHEWVVSFIKWCFCIYGDDHMAFSLH